MRTHSPQHLPPKLLVSVRCPNEAEQCRVGGVEWIDLKEPQNGALGSPTLEVARLVALQLQDHPQRSIALGELVELDLELAVQLATYFPILKVGLAGTANARDTARWLGKLETLHQRLQAQDAVLVPVIYADWQRCNAMEPTAVLKLAAQWGAPFVLIDTHTKDGSRLLNHLDMDRLTTLLEQAAEGGAKLVLAGSLTLEQARQLRGLAVEAIGVRGAVCEASRVGTICKAKLASWVEEFSSPTTKFPILNGSK